MVLKLNHYFHTSGLSQSNFLSCLKTWKKIINKNRIQEKMEIKFDKKFDNIYSQSREISNV